MTNLKFYCLGLLLVLGIFAHAQTKMLYGKILNQEEVEGIHILNVRSQGNTITNSEGAFQLPVNKQDTLMISSIKYVPVSLVVSQEIFEKGVVFLTLETTINELEEVLLFPLLSGNLERDVKKIPVVDALNFDDVGIPGFKGKPEEKIPKLVGQVITPTAVNLEGLYKHLTGYYKMLRTKRKWDAENTVAMQIMHHYTAQFFEEVYGISERGLFEFVLYCLETTDLQSAFLNQNHGKIHDIFAIQSKVYRKPLEGHPKE